MSSRRLALTAGTGVAVVGLVAALAITQGSMAAEIRPTRVTAEVPPPDDTGFVPGANDFECEPPAEHPNPVVLVHGTFENMSNNWLVAAPRLASEGFCVFAFNYGGNPGDLIQGTGPVATSAHQLSLVVDKVLAATGASEVDIVGHSQGGRTRCPGRMPAPGRRRHLRRPGRGSHDAGRVLRQCCASH